MSGESKPRYTDFSVESILGLRRHQHKQPDFQWLHCTRYRPPKLPRTRRTTEDGDQTHRQRRLGRTPRVPFYRWQVTLLEQQYQRHNYLSTTAISELAAMLQLSYNRVKIWFQNRRAKERRKEEMKRVLQEGNDCNKGAIELEPSVPLASPSPPAPAVSPPSPQYTSLRTAAILPPPSLQERTVNSQVSVFSNYQLYHTAVEEMRTMPQSQPPVTEQCLITTNSEYKNV